MEIPMEVITCCYTSCGLTFCVPAGWVRLRQADHKSWCCPNGHIQSFTGKTEADGLRERLAASENEISAKLKTERKLKKELRKLKKLGVEVVGK